jgi:NitT/TauT family transport system substrate-binding protein
MRYNCHIPSLSGLNRRSSLTIKLASSHVDFPVIGSPNERRYRTVKRKLLIVTLILPLLLTSCAQATPEVVTIRVAVLPVLDTLPLYVAQAEGFFSREGVKVELVPVNAAPERDQLMQSGQIDAMLNEIVSVLLFNKDTPRIVALRFARIATETSPVFRIVASAESGISTVADLRAVPIGISEGTVIEYTTDRMLENAGLSSEQISKLAVPKIPDRLNLLASGQLKAANLPDPAASLAILNGAVPIIDDSTYPEIGHSVLSFSRDFVSAHPEAVRSFLRAVEQAVLAINRDKQAWNGLLIEQNLVPTPLIDRYELPDYPLAGVPSQAQFADVLAWTQEKGLISTEITYDSSVDGSYLP